MDTRIEEILDFWENKLPEYYSSDVIRLTQVQMSLDIADFLLNESRPNIFILEAPVGTGKSLGALIPAMLEKKHRILSSQVIYATATINLQGQLTREEVPLLKKYGLVNKYILAKGKGNYYCHERAMESLHRYKNLKESLISFFEQAETGHRDEYENIYRPLENKLWENFNLEASSYECRNCTYSLNCPTQKHRSRFLSSSNDLIITNHDQLIRSFLNFQDMESASKPILPTNPGIIIIDEAHDFLENFLGQTEVCLKLNTLSKVKHLIPKLLKNKYSRLMEKFWSLYTEEKSSVESAQGRYKLSEKARSMLISMKSCIDEAMLKEESKNIGKNLLLYKNEDSKIQELEEISAAIRKITSASYVSWVCYEDNTVHAVNKGFTSSFRNFLLELAKYNKVVIMSGTLTTNGDFTPMLDLWHLTQKDVRKLALPTSFSYRDQAKIYVPDGLVSPKESATPEYTENQVEKIISIIEMCGGRSLILATSKTHMNNVFSGITPYLEKQGINSFVQDSSSVEVLSDKFKKDETSVLIGSGSFFSGISVKGESLLCVIITRLPFPVPEDPYIDLLGEGLEGSKFMSVSFPHMMVKLNQAVGRLIRDISDYGIVSILDERLYTNKEYGSIIYDSFEKLGYIITRNHDEVSTFIKRGKENVKDISYAKYSRDKLTMHKALSKKMLARKTTNYDILGYNVGMNKKLEKKYLNHRTQKVKEFIESNITDEQYQFAENILASKKKTKKDIKNILTSKRLFEYLFDLFYKDNEDTRVVTDHFPYNNDEQRKEFVIYKGVGSRTYKLKPEELDELNRRLAKQNRSYI